MKRLFTVLGLAISLLASPIQAQFSQEIIETAHFSQILDHLAPGTLVILDIDDTLMIPSQTLGSDVWFLERWKHHFSRNPNKADAKETCISEWEAIRHITQMKLVEEGTEAIVAELQNKGYSVMALTTQGLALATRTRLQLLNLGIDTTKTAPSSHSDYYFMNEHGVLYRNGILFTSGTAKGSALLKLLNLLQVKPERLLFINDKETHIRDLAAAAEQLEIPFTGLRYSYSDARIRAYNPKLAHFQFTHSSFDHILSDEEALAQMELEAASRGVTLK